MEEKKEIKISLGTVICIVIIVILLCALAFVYYLGFIKEDSKEIAKTQDNEIVFQEKTNSNKIENDDNKESILAENKVENEITNEPETEQTNTYDWSVVNTSKIVNKEQGYIYSTTYSTPANINYVISNNKKTITIDTDKKIDLPKAVKEVCLHYVGQGSLDFYTFLYEDGTVSYTVDYGNNIKDFKSLKNIIKLFPLEYSRKVEWDNGEMVDLVESTIVAIDNSGNIYDLGLMRNK